MNVTKTTQPQDFTPVTLTYTLQSQDEVDAITTAHHALKKATLAQDLSSDHADIINGIVMLGGRALLDSGRPDTIDYAARHSAVA